MRLVELVRQETGATFDQIVLLRHVNSIDRLIELGGSVEEFSSLQPTDTKWDFWADGKPQIHVIVVIVHNRVFGVYRVIGVEAEGTIKSLVSDAYRQFDIERERWKPDRLVRRFTMILIPCTAINETITGWEGKEINPVIRSNAKLFSKIEVNLSESAIRLPDQKGDRDWVDNDASYIPQDVDRRETVERQIRERRGQQQFRDALRARYGDRCLVTGCDVLAVLEAAHIKPYRGKDDHHPENGLLLRSDIHTLFDLDLLGIEPDRMQIELHPNLADDEEYAKLGDKTLSCERDQHPSHEALRIRYEQFKKRVHRAGMRFPPLVGPPNK